MEENKPYKVINGNSLEVLDNFEENTFDSCITDPPYELGFMGKKWDNTGIAYNVELWKKVLKVLKPGAYLCAFGGTRTFHRIACAIEDAGFEIRDTMMYLYGTGFPKSMNIGLALDRKMGVESEIVGTIYKPNSPHPGGHETSFNDGVKYHDGICVIKKSHNEWSGWGTSLKPAYEPIIVARKPVEKSTIDNVIKYGVGAINIDECRIEFENTPNPATNPLYRQQHKDIYKQIEKGQESKGAVNFTSSKNDISSLGRFPANVIHDGSKEVISGMPETKSTGGSGEASTTKCFSAVNCGSMKNTGANLGGLGDEGNASRYFYSAKASKKDRDEGLDMFESIKVNDGRKTEIDNAFQRGETPRKNYHPTVKPTELMQYLIRLYTPKGGHILEPFAGSGSTGKAAMFENREREANYKITMIELTKDYIPIIEARCDYALNKYEYEQKMEEIKTGQQSLFNFNFSETEELENEKLK